MVNGTFGFGLCCWKLHRCQNNKGNGNTVHVCSDQESLYRVVKLKSPTVMSKISRDRVGTLNLEF